MSILFLKFFDDVVFFCFFVWIYRDEDSIVFLANLSVLNCPHYKQFFQKFQMFQKLKLESSILDNLSQLHRVPDRTLPQTFPHKKESQKYCNSSDSRNDFAIYVVSTKVLRREDM